MAPQIALTVLKIAAQMHGDCRVAARLAGGAIQEKEAAFQNRGVQQGVVTCGVHGRETVHVARLVADRTLMVFGQTISIHVRMVFGAAPWGYALTRQSARLNLITPNGVKPLNLVV